MDNISGSKQGDKVRKNNTRDISCILLCIALQTTGEIFSHLS